MPFVPPKLPNSVWALDLASVQPGSIYGAAGAGVGKLVTGVSHVVGRNAPVVSGPASGSTAVAKSENVSVTGAVAGSAVGPPTSPIRTYLTPVGPTSRTSMLSGNTCDRSYSVTLILKTLAVAPVTVIFDGYGLAGDAPVITIGVVLQNAAPWFAVSFIVRTAVPGVPIPVPLLGLDKVKLTVSFGSKTLSRQSGISTVCDVDPAANVTVCDVIW